MPTRLNPVVLLVSVFLCCLIPSQSLAYNCIPDPSGQRAPVAHINGPGCSRQWYPSPISGKSACYYPISRETSGAFSGIIDLRRWLEHNEADFPFFVPFSDPKVKVITGWTYGKDTCGCDAKKNSVCGVNGITYLNECRAKCAGVAFESNAECATGDWDPDSVLHNAIDYAKHDSRGRQIKFQVHAPADGTVIASYYNQSGGNIIIIEHVDPHNPENVVRSVYHHLINGRDADIELALATDMSGPDADRYRERAKIARECLDSIQEGRPSECLEDVERRWGQNEDLILVKEKDTVFAGQMIGWAGSTGVHSGGPHLHFAVARRAQHLVHDNTRTGAPLVYEHRWTFFDPSGFYGGASTLNSCYNNPSQSCYSTPAAYPILSQHCSTYAPVFQDFVGLSYQSYPGVERYFSNVGYYPAVLSTESSGWDWKISGSFTHQSSPPVVRYMRTFAENQADYNALTLFGWQPVLKASMAAPDEPRFTTIYRQTTDSVISRAKMTSTWFDELFGDYYTLEYRLEVQSPFIDGGGLYWSGIWTQQPYVTGQFRYYHQTLNDIWNHDASLTGSGYKMASLVRYQLPGTGDRYAAIWHKSTIPTIVDYDLDATSFRPVRDWWFSRSYRIHAIQSYNGAHQVIFKNR